MRLFSAILILLLFSFLWALGHTMDWTGKNHHEPEAVVVDSPSTPNVFVRGTDLRLLNFNGKSLIGNHEQFEFAAGAKAPKSLSANNNKFLDQVVTYMKANPNANLKLIGKYLRNERNTSIQDNMGAGRAASVRDLLEKRGIAKTRVGVEGKIVRTMPTNEPVSFNILKSAEKPLAEKNTTFKNMDFYFETNATQFTPSQQLVNWANEAKKYFAENPNKALNLTGHTDSDGDPMYNKNLGMQRARAVKAYLVNLGIKNKINISSQGDAQPVASNTTAANKRQNRRVNARIN